MGKKLEFVDMNNTVREELNKEYLHTAMKVTNVCIVCNLMLCLMKLAGEFAANSNALISDGINSVFDVLSGFIVIVGAQIAEKKPDKEHPYGFARYEYVCAFVISLFMLVTGIIFAKESFVKIIHPENSEYTNVSLIIIGVAVVVKFFFGMYVKNTGKKVSSDALIASGTDSFMDSILSFSTFIAALISRFFGVNLESYLGLILSVFIIKAGFEIFKETLGSIIGGRADSEFSQNIKKKIRAYDGVLGAYDLILHDYGPSRSIGSVHIEVASDMTADKIHLLTRHIIADVHKEFGIVLTVGIYASNNNDAAGPNRH